MAQQFSSAHLAPSSIPNTNDNEGRNVMIKQWKAIACLLLAHGGCAMAAEALPLPAELSLAQAIGIALESNHDAKLSALAVRSAESATVVANAAPNPSLTIQSSSINPREGIGPGSLRDKNVDTTVHLDQLVERGGKRRFRTESASYLEQAARLDLNDNRRQLRLGVSQAYYDLLAAQDRLAAARETADLFDATLGAAQKRKKAGDIAGADVERVQLDALRARNDARQAEADLAKARLSLAMLLGTSSAADAIRAADRWPALTEAHPAASLDQLIEQRSDVKAGRARVDAALAARSLALSLRTRDVSVGLQFEHSPGNSSNNTFGISLQVPLFTSYHYEGEIGSAEAALDSANENLAKVRTTARSEIHRSRQDLQATAERTQRFQQELLVAARKSADAAEFGFRNGAMGVMDVLDARRTYRLTQLDAVTAQADYAKALAAWRAAVMEDDQK